MKHAQCIHGPIEGLQKVLNTRTLYAMINWLWEGMPQLVGAAQDFAYLNFACMFLYIIRKKWKTQPTLLNLSGPAQHFALVINATAHINRVSQSSFPGQCWSSNNGGCMHGRRRVRDPERKHRQFVCRSVCFEIACQRQRKHNLVTQRKCYCY